MELKIYELLLLPALLPTTVLHLYHCPPFYRVFLSHHFADYVRSLSRFATNLFSNIQNARDFCCGRTFHRSIAVAVAVVVAVAVAVACCVYFVEFETCYCLCYCLQVLQRCAR